MKKGNKLFKKRLSTGMSIYFLNDVTSEKMNFRPDITQNLFCYKIRISRVCVAYKTI